MWRAAARYAEAGLLAVPVAGERYGTGSSRDWAAKGARLLGARAVPANSFERIHRANLVCMGVPPLRLPEGWRPQNLGLVPGDTLEVEWNPADLTPRGAVRVVLRWAASGQTLAGTATALLDTAREVALVRAGGMIPTILRRALASSGNPWPWENRAGASAMIAAQAVARGAEAGHTLLMAAAGEIAANPALYKQHMTHDPARELTPVASVAAVPNVRVVHPSVPARTPAELLAYARANPGKLSYASSGIGNPQHLAGELLDRMAGTEILHVPYRGASPAPTDVAGGRVTMNFSGLGPVLPFLRDGGLVAVGGTSRERMPQLPEVPALSEAPGLGEYELVNWFGLFAPASMPAPAVERLHGTVAAALGDPALSAKLMEQGAVARPMSAAEFRDFVAAQTRTLTRIIEEADVTPEG